MPIVIEKRKPRIDLLGSPLAKIPSKNYLFNLLYRHLAEGSPARGLGQFFFPGSYGFQRLHLHAVYIQDRTDVLRRLAETWNCHSDAFERGVTRSRFIRVP